MWRDSLERIPAWWWLVPVLLLSFWLGARGLNMDSLWADEYRSIQDAGGGSFARRTPIDVWHGVAERNPWHAPGYFVVLSGWGALTGWQPPILRALSLLAGMLTVAWTYRLGRTLLSARGGLYAAAVVGTSVMFVYYLHELRTYTLLTLLTTMLLWHYLYLMNRRSRPRAWHWLGLGSSAVGALYLQYFALPVLGAVGIYHMVFAPLHRRRWRGVMVTLLLAGLLFVPWISVILVGMSKVEGNEELHEQALSTLEVVQYLLTIFSNEGVLLVVLTLAAAGYALVMQRRRKAATVWYFAAAVLVLMLVVNIALELLTARRMRYVMPIFPLLALLVSLGLVTLERWRVNRAPVGQIAAGVLLALWLVGGVNYTLSGRYHFPVFPFHTVSDALRGQLQTNDMVIHLGENTNSNRTGWSDRLLHFYLDPLVFETALIGETTTERLVDLQATVLQSLRHTPRANVWLLIAPNPDMSHIPRVREALDARHAQCATDFTVSGVQIQEYARSPVCCSGERDVSDAMLRYANGIALLAVEPLPETLADETLAVSASWYIPADVPANAYSVSFQVYDAARAKVGQADVTLDAVAFACSSIDIPLPALDAGAYTLEAVVYAWETGERLTATRVGDGTMSDLQVIGAFDIG